MKTDTGITKEKSVKAKEKPITIKVDKQIIDLINLHCYYTEELQKISEGGSTSTHTKDSLVSKMRGAENSLMWQMRQVVIV